MNLWVKRQIRSLFGLVEYERVDQAYSGWMRASNQWATESRRMADTIFLLTETNDRLAKELSKSKVSLAEAGLRLAMASVAPLEGISKGLDKLYAVRDALASDGRFDVSELDTALIDIENGYRLARDSKNGATHVDA